MDLTNEEDITYDKSPAEIEKTVDTMLRHVITEEDPFDLPESILLGVFFREDVSLSFLGSARDAYDLLSGDTRLEASIFDAIALVTCGWAAPIVPADDISELIPASQSPDRSRVRVVMIAGAEGICAAVRFANNPGNVTIDEGASGPLGEALLEFWT